MIKGIILDVDGVIIGGKPGFNFPLPHKNILDALRLVSKKGVSISFCTAKPGFVISNLVKQIGLAGVHISNGGAEIINHLQNKIIKKHSIDQKSAIGFVREMKIKKLYTEAYTTEGYAIENDKFCKLTEINIKILNTDPIQVPSLERFAIENEIIKIMPAAFDSEQKQIIETIMIDFPNLQLQWGGNPMYAPTLFGVVTKKGVTKKSGAYDIIKYTGVSFNEMLGIGDGLSDWEFMQLCKYTGTVANAEDKVKENILNRGCNGFIGGSVDENGILDIFSFFKVL